MDEVLKIEDRQLTQDEFEEVLRAFFLKGYQRGACAIEPTLSDMETHFQTAIYYFGLKTK